MTSNDPLDRKSFGALLADVKLRIQTAQTRAMLAVNTELVRLYWDIGRMIDARQKLEGWGAGVIPRLATELKNEFPELKGFSERNIKRMLAFYRDYRDPASIQQPAARLAPSASNEVQPIDAQRDAISPQVATKLPNTTDNGFLQAPSAELALSAKVTQVAAQFDRSLLWPIPWFHHVVLMENIKDMAVRRWYMEQTLSNGWSRNILAIQIEAQAHTRHGKARSNFPLTLPQHQSDLAQQALKDPYIFDFLTTLTSVHLAALRAGKTLALDVRDEYIQFVKVAARKTPSKSKTEGRNATRRDRRHRAKHGSQHKSLAEGDLERVNP